MTSAIEAKCSFHLYFNTLLLMHDCCCPFRSFKPLQLRVFFGPGGRICVWTGSWPIREQRGRSSPAFGAWARFYFFSFKYLFTNAFNVLNDCAQQWLLSIVFSHDSGQPGRQAAQVRDQRHDGADGRPGHFRDGQRDLEHRRSRQRLRPQHGRGSAAGDCRYGTNRFAWLQMWF